MSADLANATEVLQRLAVQIPDGVFGVERQMEIGKILAGINPADRLALRLHFERLLDREIETNAADLAFGGFGGHGKIWYRTYGAMRPDPDMGTLECDQAAVLIQSVLMEQQRWQLYERRNLDFSYSLVRGDIIHRFRCDAYLDLDHCAVAIRAVQAKIRPYKDLGFHHNVTKIMSLVHTKSGLTLITGITGSGKSATLDSIVELNNTSVDGHIVIIAEPVEYVHRSNRCIIRHREVGRDVLSFKEGTIQSLRQNPDIIIIGEMRDPDTILTALEVTDSGHKVFSTLHTSSAVESIDRIIAEVPSIEQERVRNRLADVLRCVVSQKLVPSLDGKVILAKEVMLMTPSVRAAIKNNNTQEIYQMISEGGELGMITMEQDLRRLHGARRISIEMAMNFANNKRRMEQLLSAGQQSKAI